MTTTRRGTKTNPQAADMAGHNTTAQPRTRTRPAPAATRTPPYLPTALESMCLLVFPAILVFGSVYSVVNPETRAAPYDAVSQSHAQEPGMSPNYFARKSNLFNVLFVKRGWAWVTLGSALVVCTHPSYGPLALTRRRAQAALRLALATGWWFVVTQWCFGPAIIDRGFRWTGGRCELAEREVRMGRESVGEMITAVACKASGGQWQGGHDISGHVFLLVLGSALLMQELGWVAVRWTGWEREERCVVMPDGALKSASVEADAPVGAGAGGRLVDGIGAQTASWIIGLSLWMLLTTAIYFHTWFEKVCTP